MASGRYAGVVALPVAETSSVTVSLHSQKVPGGGNGGGSQLTMVFRSRFMSQGKHVPSNPPPPRQKKGKKKRKKVVILFWHNQA